MGHDWSALSRRTFGHLERLPTTSPHVRIIMRLGISIGCAWLVVITFQFVLPDTGSEQSNSLRENIWLMAAINYGAVRIIINDVLSILKPLMRLIVAVVSGALISGASLYFLQLSSLDTYPNYLVGTVLVAVMSIGGLALEHALFRNGTHDLTPIGARWPSVILDRVSEPTKYQRKSAMRVYAVLILILIWSSAGSVRNSGVNIPESWLILQLGVAVGTLVLLAVGALTRTLS